MNKEERGRFIRIDFLEKEITLAMELLDKDGLAYFILDKALLGEENDE